MTPAASLVAALRTGHVLDAHQLARLKADFSAAQKLAAVDLTFARLFANANGVSALAKAKRVKPPGGAYASSPNAGAGGAVSGLHQMLTPASATVVALRNGKVLEAHVMERLKADYEEARLLAARDPKFARLFFQFNAEDAPDDVEDGGGGGGGGGVRQRVGAGHAAAALVVSSGGGTSVRDEAVLAWYLRYRERFGLLALQEGVALGHNTANTYAAAGPTKVKLRPPAPLRGAENVAPQEVHERERERRASIDIVLAQAAVAAQSATSAAEMARHSAMEAQRAAVEARKQQQEQAGWQPIQTLAGVPSWVELTSKRGQW